MGPPSTKWLAAHSMCCAMTSDQPEKLALICLALSAFEFGHGLKQRNKKLIHNINISSPAITATRKRMKFRFGRMDVMTGNVCVFY